MKFFKSGKGKNEILILNTDTDKPREPPTPLSEITLMKQPKKTALHVAVESGGNVFFRHTTDSLFKDEALRSFFEQIRALFRAEQKDKSIEEISTQYFAINAIIAIERGQVWGYASAAPLVGNTFAVEMVVSHSIRSISSQDRIHTLVGLLLKAKNIYYAIVPAQGKEYAKLALVKSLFTHCAYTDIPPDLQQALKSGNPGYAEDRELAALAEEEDDTEEYTPAYLVFVRKSVPGT